MLTNYLKISDSRLQVEILFELVSKKNRTNDLPKFNVFFFNFNNLQSLISINLAHR